MSPKARRLRWIVLIGMGVLIVAAVGIFTWIGPEQRETRLVIRFDGVVAGTAPPLGRFSVINQGETSVVVFGIIVQSGDPKNPRQSNRSRLLPWQALRPGKTNHISTEIPSPPGRGLVAIQHFVLTPRREVSTRLAQWTSGRRWPEFIRRLLEVRIDGQVTQIDFQASPASSITP